MENYTFPSTNINPSMSTGGIVPASPSGPLTGTGAPTFTVNVPLDQTYYDRSTTPWTQYTFNGSTWQAGGNAYATTTTPGIVKLFDTDSFVGADDTKVPTSLTVKTFVENTAIAGGTVATETAAGIGQLATNAEAVAGTPSTGALALFVTPSNLASVFAAPPAIGGTTPAAAAFTNLTAAAVGTGISLVSDTASVFDVTGAGVDLTLSSDAGRVIINGEEAAANAITIVSAVGGVDLDAALQVNIASSQNAVDAIRIVASAGGIDIDAVGAATEDINITNTGGSVVISATESAQDAIVINATAGGIDILASGAAAGEDIDITATGSSINLTSTENAALAIYLHADGGASETIRLRSDQGTGADSIDILSDVGGVTLTSGLASADAINIVASDAAGGIDIDSGTNGVALDTTGAVNVTSTKNAAASIYLRANGGTSETVKIHADQGTGVASLDLLSDVGGITLTAGVASADAINIVTSNAAGGIDIDSGTNGFIVDTTGAFSLDSAATSNVTVTGAGADLNLGSVLGSVLVSATENAALAIRLHANGGTSETIQIHSDQGTGVASIGLLSDDGGITIRSTALASADAINLEAAAGGIDMDAALLLSLTSTRDNAQAILLEATAGGIDILASGAAAGEDIDIVATGSSVNITSTESAADSIVLTSTVGGIQILAAGAAAGEDIVLTATGSSIRLTATESATDSINIESTAGGVNILASGAAAGEDINITATGSSVNVTATEAAANAIVLSASNAAGGIDLTTGGGSIDLSSAGSVTMVAGTDSQAGDTCTVNKNVFAATYTGFTTAAGSSQVFNVTNSVVTTSSQVMITLCNEGSNDAQMTVTRVKRTAGQLQVTAKNNGASALNGNVTITGWILNT